MSRKVEKSNMHVYEFVIYLFLYISMNYFFFENYVLFITIKVTRGPLFSHKVFYSYFEVSFTQHLNTLNSGQFPAFYPNLKFFLFRF